VIATPVWRTALRDALGAKEVKEVLEVAPQLELLDALLL